jgi:hypothetical protein
MPKKKYSSNLENPCRRKKGGREGEVEREREKE